MVVKFTSKIQDDPDIINLLHSMPEPVKDSFTEEQLSHLKVAVAAKPWRQHSIDVRGTFRGFRHRYYYVFLAGKNQRGMTREAGRFSRLAKTAFLAIVLFGVLSIMLVALYIIKSALGIDIFENYSLGFWDWLNNR